MKMIYTIATAVLGLIIFGLDAASAQDRSRSPAPTAESPGVSRYVENFIPKEDGDTTAVTCKKAARSVGGYWLNASRMDMASGQLSCKVGFNPRYSTEDVDTIINRYQKRYQATLRRRAEDEAINNRSQERYQARLMKRAEHEAKVARAKQEFSTCNPLQELIYFETSEHDEAQNKRDVDQFYNRKAFEAIANTDLAPNEHFLLTSYVSRSTSNDRDAAKQKAAVVSNKMITEAKTSLSERSVKLDVKGSGYSIFSGSPFDERNNVVVVSVACYDMTLGPRVMGTPEPKRMDIYLERPAPQPKRRAPYAVVEFTPQRSLPIDPEKSYFYSDIDFKTVYQDDELFKRLVKVSLDANEMLYLRGHLKKDFKGTDEYKAREADYMAGGLRRLLNSDFGIPLEKMKAVPHDFSGLPTAPGIDDHPSNIVTVSLAPADLP